MNGKTLGGREPGTSGPIKLSAVAMLRRRARTIAAFGIFGVTTSATIARAGEPTAPAGWVSRSIPAASDREWGCANWSRDEWIVSTAAGPLEISHRDPTKPVIALPFKPPPATEEDITKLKGPSVVQAVPGGFLIGYDRGEFGGGLYWFSTDGRKHVRIAPPAGARSDWFPENVHAIAEYEGTFFVFQGVSHLTLRLGRVLKVRPSGKGWRAAVFVGLDVTPEVVLQERTGVWLMASTDGVSRITANGKVERLWGRPEVLVGTYPNSIARSSDGNVYVGMRAWVLRLTWAQAEARWRADLLAPASCIRLQLTAEGRCSCVAAEAVK